MSVSDALKNTWGKILLVVLPTALIAAATLVTMREKVARLEVDVRGVQGSQVTREELRGQTDAILREIAGLRQDVRDLRRPR